MLKKPPVQPKKPAGVIWIVWVRPIAGFSTTLCPLAVSRLMVSLLRPRSTRSSSGAH